MTIKEHVFDMTNFRNFAALCATVAFMSIGLGVSAQDDLDDLLADLESDSAETSTSGGESAQPAAESEVEAEAEAEAEEPVEAEAEVEAEEPVEAEAEVEEAEEPVEAEAEAEVEAEAAPVAEAPAAAPVAAMPENDDVDEVLDLLSELAAESGEEPTAVAATEEAAVAATVKTPAAKPSNRSAADEEILEYVRTTEKLRREALDLEAMREITAARASMTSGEYLESVKHYGIAIKLLNDRPSSKDLKRECNLGMADGLYLAAIEEDRTGRRERAIKLIEKAIERRHPKARRQLEAWLTAEDPDKNKTDVSEIIHRRNEQQYKERRARDRQHLKRAKQLLAQDELDRASEECELVLLSSPYDKEAIRLRGVIQRKRLATLKKEHQSTRDGMIADVEEAWRPVYAVDARELEDIQKGDTIKRPLEPGSELTVEQSIIKRMKEMKLPTISFKPPATIGDAVEYFRGASKDFDRPEIPLEQRGFNFILKTPEPIRAAAAASEEAEGEDGFGDMGDEEGALGGGSGLPVIQMISASDITLYDALKLVCESVAYKFTVQGPFVMVMPREMSTEELVTRSFPVLSTFLDKMSSATEDMTTMRESSAFGSSSRRNDDDEGVQEKDWKQFFTLLGIDWPEGSSIFYVKTVGRLFVKNTQDNLAEFENVLLSLNQQVTLVEIETRFVEVCQDDLNSLGFEWILNNDCSVDVNGKVAKALGLRDGRWNVNSRDQSTTTQTQIDYKDAGGITYGSEVHTTTVTTSNGAQSNVGSGNAWVEGAGSGKTLGINGFGGNSNYTSGQRFLSSMDNHISGQGYSKNDQFMRANVFLGAADLSMILHMLSQRSDTDLLSAPKVLTRPGEEAVMKVVSEYIYPTDYDVTLSSNGSSSGGSYGNSSSGSSPIAIVEPQSFTMREVGVILQVTPTLTDDGNVVDLELNTQVVDEPTWKNYGMKIPYSGNTSLQNFQGIGEIFTGLSSIFTTLGEAIPTAMKATLAESATVAAEGALNNLTKEDGMTYYDVPMEQPFFHVRSIDSKVSVYPGATIVMGGLIREERKAIDDKVPYLGDLPFIGRLFRSHAEQTSKRNLLIFVTTRIVDGRGREMHNDGLELGGQPEVKPAPDGSGN